MRVWDEILVTVDGFEGFMWEKHAQSQSFGIFGPGRAGGGGYHGGGGVGEPRTGIIHAPEHQFQCQTRPLRADFGGVQLYIQSIDSGSSSTIEGTSCSLVVGYLLLG